MSRRPAIGPARLLAGTAGFAALALAALATTGARADVWEPGPAQRGAVYKDSERFEHRAPRHVRHVRHVHRAPCAGGHQDHVSCGNGYYGPQVRAFTPPAMYYHAAPSYSVPASYGAASAHYYAPVRSYHYGYAGGVISTPFFNAPLYNRPCLC